MGEPFDQFKKNPEPLVRHISIQVVVNCACGAIEPIVVHFIPGANLRGVCPRCDNTFALALLNFSINDPEKGFKVAVAAIPPAIIKPRMTS